jgi:basic amino acid/polyamine antiporter, APA family
MYARTDCGAAGRSRLKRTLSLPYVVLYGTGVTVGAVIYVLVGEVIALSGDHAPLAFLIAGLVMLLPAACFAELTGRMLFASAEAHFVRAGFNSSFR